MVGEIASGTGEAADAVPGLPCPRGPNVAGALQVATRLRNRYWLLPEVQYIGLGFATWPSSTCVPLCARHVSKSKKQKQKQKQKCRLSRCPDSLAAGFVVGIASLNGCRRSQRKSAGQRSRYASSADGHLGNDVTCRARGILGHGWPMRSGCRNGVIA